MFVPAPIDRNFKPYTKRHVLKRNAALFVSGTGGNGGGALRVVPQSQECMIKGPGAPCGCDPATGICIGTCNRLYQCEAN
jgi:hypothetical protein